MLDDYKHMKGNIDKDFFKKFPDQMMDRIKNEDLINLETDAPILFSIGKQTGFKVPEKYFEELEIKTPVQHEPKIRRLGSMQWLSIAASFIILFCCVFLLKPESVKTAGVVNLDDFDESEVVEELFENDDDIMDEIFLDELTDFEDELEIVELDELIEANIDEFELTELAELL